MSDLTFWGEASVEEAQAEIERGTSLEAGYNERSPLHEAAAYNTVGVVRLLVSKGLDVTAQDLNGDTPLHFAAEHSADPEIPALLLDHGADVNAKNQLGKTPLHIAAESSDAPWVVRALLERGADKDARTSGGQTACWLAVSRDADEEIRRLLCLPSDLVAERA